MSTLEDIKAFSTEDICEFITKKIAEINASTVYYVVYQECSCLYTLREDIIDFTIKGRNRQSDMLKQSLRGMR